MRRLALLLVAVLGAGIHAGCSSSGADCVSLCQESQQQGCEISHGDCDAFCNAAVQVTDEAGCGDGFDKLLDCIEGGETCTSRDRCATQFSTSESCATTYCAGHGGEAACKELTAQLF